METAWPVRGTSDGPAQQPSIQVRPRSPLSLSKPPGRGKLQTRSTKSLGSIGRLRVRSRLDCVAHQELFTQPMAALT
jgi:hypothetical protein